MMNNQVFVFHKECFQVPMLLQVWINNRKSKYIFIFLENKSHSVGFLHGQPLRAILISKTSAYQYRDSHNRLIFIMETPIPGKRLFIEKGNWLLASSCQQALGQDAGNLPQALSMLWENLNYHQVSNISRTLVVNKIVDRSDVVGASPVGAAPTTSSFST